MDVHPLIKASLQDPEAFEDAMRQIGAEESLAEYVKLMWPIIDPATPLVWGLPPQAICEHLEAVSSGEIKRLLINVPPGTTKSTIVSVLWPTWEWGPRNNPWLRMITATNALDLSLRLNQLSRDVIYSDLYQKCWGDRFQLRSDQNAKGRYKNDQTGFRQAASVGSNITGHRGDRLIVDDPHSTQEAESDLRRDEVVTWFSRTLQTRTNNKDSAIVVIMQRLHERDVSGLIMAEDLGYEHLMLPMEFEPDRKCFTCIGFEDPRTEEGELLFPERFDEEQVEDLKKAMRAIGGTYAEAGQLQQRPSPKSGGMFDPENFEELVVEPDLSEFTEIVRGWDLASSLSRSAAYTVGAKLGKTSSGRIVVLHIVRGRFSPGKLEQVIKETAMMDGLHVIQDFPQDPGQAGKSQVSSFARMLHGYTFHSSPETGSKETRALPFAAQVESGNVDIIKAKWNNAFLNEASLFPNGEFLDQIDACSRAYMRLMKARQVAIPVALPILDR